MEVKNEKKLLNCFRCVVYPACPLACSEILCSNQGSILLGGAAGFTSQGGDIVGDERLTTITIIPSFLYFIAPNVAIGGTISLINTSRSGNSSTLLGIGPKVAYYFGDQNKKTFPFIAGSFIYNSRIDAYTKSDILFSGGFTTLLNKYVGITGEAFYLIENRKWEGSDKSHSGNTFGFQLGIAAFIF
jgi:hypothetical protein